MNSLRNNNLFHKPPGIFQSAIFADFVEDRIPSFVWNTFYTKPYFCPSFSAFQLTGVCYAYFYWRVACCGFVDGRKQAALIEEDELFVRVGGKWIVYRHSDKNFLVLTTA